LDHTGTVKVTRSYTLAPCDSASDSASFTAPTTVGRYWWKIEAYAKSPDVPDDTVDVEVIVDYFTLIYETSISITEKVDIYSEPPRRYEASITIDEVVTIYAEPPRVYESLVTIEEVISVYSEPPRVYESSITIDEVVSIFSEAPRIYMAKLEIVEKVDAYSEPPRIYETKIEIAEMVITPFRTYEVKLGIIDKVFVPMPRMYEVRINVQDFVNVIVPRLIKSHIDELKDVIAKMKYRRTGDIVEPEDFNLITKALRKQANINEAMLV